jgi:peptidoglycan/LPS O-acetylase OafA/YrhL
MNDAAALPAPATASTVARNNAFDVIKGVLVLVMVAYHVMSIMSSARFEDFRYLRFVSGSFIFISGFVLTRFFAASFQSDAKAASGRLIVRGLKVLALFTALNLLIQSSGVGNVQKPQLGHEGYWQHAASIYLQGNGRMSSFLILLPIAYLLMLAPAVLWLLSRQRTGAGWWLLAATLLLAAWPATTADAPVLEFMLIGLAGLCLGKLTPSDKLRGRHLARRLLNRWPPALALAGLVLSLWFTGRFNHNLAAYTLGIAAMLKCLYDLACVLSSHGPAGRGLALLGRYSLATYIAQIVFIQMLFRLSHQQRWQLGLPLMAFGLSTALAMWGLCVMLERLRARWQAVDRSYRLIFS